MQSSSYCLLQDKCIVEVKSILGYLGFYLIPFFFLWTILILVGYKNNVKTYLPTYLLPNSPSWSGRDDERLGFCNTC